MTVIRIDNFGGQMPSVSPRALPLSAAQTNRDLFLGSSEFRPLLGDTFAAAGLAGAKTLYRIDQDSDWILSTSELSYARGQNNNDATKRTYYANNTTAAALRTFDKDGNDRQLGVPSPTETVVTTTAGVVFTIDSLIESVRQAIEGSIIDQEPDIRYTGTTPVAGPFTVPSGALYFANDTVNLPTDITNAGEHWKLYAKVTAARVALLDIKLADVGVAFSDASFAYIPIVALPYGYVENGVPLATSLPAIVNPRTSTQVLTAQNITDLQADVSSALDSEENAYSLRTELTSFVTEFFNMLFVYPDKPAAIPGGGTVTDPTGNGPSHPTTPEWIFEGGSEYRNPDWVDYNDNLAGYLRNKADYNQLVKDNEIYNRSATDRIRDLQEKAQVATRQIEAIQLVLWTEIAKESVWVSDKLYRYTEDFSDIDAQRTIQTRFYLSAFVSDRDEESAPSPPSAQQEIDQYSSTMVAMPTVPTGRAITLWRIYRSNTVDDLTMFQFVKELPIATTSFTDTTSNAAMGEIIETIGWLEPDVGLKGLTSLPNGIMAAFKDNTLHFCEPYAPYAFPPSYQVTTEYPVVGLGAFGQTLFVGTTGNPYLISGADSASMSAIKLESNQACVSRRSISSVPGGVIYASPDGLCFVSNTGVQVATRSMFTREDWQLLVPSSIFAVTHEDIYYFFYDTGVTKGGYAFDIVRGKLGSITGVNTLTTAFVDRQADELFVCDGTAVVSVFSAQPRTALWESTLVVMPAQVGMAWLQVFGAQSADDPVTVRWYGDGALRHTATVTDITPVRLPPGRWLEHSVQVESATRVTRVTLASSTQELQGV